jgi:hypothetical protein
MAYGFIESDVIRYAMIDRDTHPDTLSKCLDLMSDYIVDDMMDEHVPHEVWTKRNEALTMACKSYDRKEYSVCFAYIKDYFAI